MHGKLATKVKTIDITRLALKTQYNSNKSGWEKEIDNTGNKISNTSRLVTKKTDQNVKFTDMEGKIPSIKDTINPLLLLT